MKIDAKGIENLFMNIVLKKKILKTLFHASLLEKG